MITSEKLIKDNAVQQGQAERIRPLMNDRFGMFIHWGISSIPARCVWMRSDTRVPDEQYHAYFREFNPVRYDARAWARAAKQAGQKYAVLIAKHHDGFCLFDTELTDFKSTNTPCERDLAREFVDAFREEGLKVGFYYSLLDWDHPDYPIDRLHPLRDDEEAKSQPRDFARYLDFMHGQVRELLTNYGKLDIMWLDFSYDHMERETWRARELVEMIRTLQPGIVINNRLASGHLNLLSTDLEFGDFATPEQILPMNGMVDEAGNPVPWEACITFNDHWGYTSADNNHKSAREVIHFLVECVSKNGNLLLNVGPSPKGEIPEENLRALEQVGKWMDSNSESIYGCAAADIPKPEWGRLTKKGNMLYAHILDKPMGPVGILGLKHRALKARLLADGTELPIQQPWNAVDCTNDVFFDLPGNRLPDTRDTVVVLELTDES